jgi:hypothetical protein
MPAGRRSESSGAAKSLQGGSLDLRCLSEFSSHETYSTQGLFKDQRGSVSGLPKSVKVGTDGRMISWKAASATAVGPGVTVERTCQAEIKSRSSCVFDATTAAVNLLFAEQASMPGSM